MSITARDIAGTYIPTAGDVCRPQTQGDVHILDTLGLLASSPDNMADIVSAGGDLSTVSPRQLLKVLSVIFPAVEDSSLIEISCRPEDYSASEVSRAVEDADCRLLGLWTRPDTDGTLRVLLRAGRRDPREAARSLERYGYEVTYTDSSESLQQISDERLAAIRLYLGIGQHSTQ